ncbi:calcium-binding protein [Pseudomonas sp. B33.4]|uniref:calcium-binding protein n=1 Tax=Pseudomonas sp. B33.4 TaxID=3104265 RepID=UPI002ADEC99C|nr:calcium-binding protein [Pseudomonas sp. B33.4]
MATLIRKASTENIPVSPDPITIKDPVIITDMNFEANERNASTLDFYNDAKTDTDVQSRRKTDQLNVVDSLFGPIQIGEISVTRVSLDALGATIDGQPLNGRNTFFRVPKRSFINSLQFSAIDIERHLKASTGSDSYLLSTLLFEMASRRPLTAPSMIKEHPDAVTDPGNYRSKLVKLLNSAQKLDLGHANLPKGNPRWVSLKSYTTLGSSVGIQAFGIFMGLRGVIDAIKVDNKAEIAINSAGIASEFASIAADVAVNKIASQMLTAGQNAYKDFAKTRFALRLGRSGGLIGGALTLPFDVFTAIRSLNAADRAIGKEALDHYVSAGLSITSAAMTVILGAAAMAGFTAAGPVGLAAGAILAIGSQVYGAVRIVDDIDDYIELTLEERWRTGWFSFCMASPDQDVQDRYTQAKARVEHSKQLKETARRLLDGKLKDVTEAIVNGKFEVHLKPTQVWKRNWWTKQDAWETVNVPEIKGSDDTIDARDGVNKDIPGAELGVAAENKSVLWFISNGRDSIKGVENKSNAFHYRSGRKELTGGKKDDRFVFEGAADLINKDADVTEYSKLKGGEGTDTLVLSGRYVKGHKHKPGYDIDLPAGTLHARKAVPPTEDGTDYVFHSLIESIENIETVEGAASVVTGTEQSNIIKSHGEDTIKAGAGNDQIHLLHEGATASGEAGADEYYIAHEAGRISVIEDGEQESFIVLNWRMDLIESWVIENNSLIITSRFDFYDRPRSVVTIHDVYKQNEKECHLKNSKLTFITKDGFFLVPELSEKIDSGKTIDVEATIIKKGQAPKPLILYTPECMILHKSDARYYLPRSGQSTTIHSGDRADAVTSLHLDYASHELSKVEAHFFARQSDKANSNELLAGCDLTYHFGEKTLTLKNFSAAGGGLDPRNMVKILRTMAVRDYLKFVLIFNDGVALNAGLRPETDVAPDDDNYERYSFRRWTTQFNLPLKFRTGQFLYELPTNEAYKLSAKNGCATLTSSPGQTAMESLEGEGSTYLIHLVADMTIKLSTPGALANANVRLPYSSTWELDATTLGDVEIKLQNNQLHIGTCIIHLPNYESEDLIDQVRVIKAHGVIHTVDLSFDRIYLDGLDARFFEEPDATKALPETLAALTDKVLKVRNIAFTDNWPEAIDYSFPAHGWISRTDKSRIEYSELRVTNRCSHQDPYTFTPLPLINVPPA